MPLAKTEFSCCVVIPCYNHGDNLARVLTQLSPLRLHCFVVDDGSNDATRQLLEQLALQYRDSDPPVTLIRLEHNSGKGAAVILGLQAAASAGFSHALQLDADGQHNPHDIPRMLTEAQCYPQALISGHPVYDDTIPRARRYGRWLTHVWVWIETLSLSLKDSMCGFRVYPLAQTLAITERYPVGKRMDFDPEIMVRLYWQGYDCRFIHTRVTYPPDGISHFKPLQDNLRISRMHSRLFFGMLPRIPRLLLRRRQRNQHWAQRREVKGVYGMRFMLWLYRVAGRKWVTLLMYPVVAVYWLLARDARRASQQWLGQVTQFYRQQPYQQQQPAPQGLNSYRHFLRFADAMLDKIAGWRGDLRAGEQIILAPATEQALRHAPGQGRLLLTSHLGDAEACRALAQHAGLRPVTALVFHQHAEGFKRIMQQLAPEAAINLIAVTDMGPQSAVMLKQRLDNGEWIAIVGDRIAVNPQRGGEWRVIWSEFLGKPAPFPQGPFILASVLRCPVALLFALRQQGRLHIHYEPFADRLLLPRNQRQQALQQMVDRYAARLQHYALLSPLDWFNFFDFWHLPEISTNTSRKE